MTTRINYAAIESFNPRWVDERLVARENLDAGAPYLVGNARRRRDHVDHVHITLASGPIIDATVWDAAVAYGPPTPDEFTDHWMLDGDAYHHWPTDEPDPIADVLARINAALEDT